MKARDHLNGLTNAFSTMGRALANSKKHPPIGITQGGSSRRKARGADVAADSATINQERKQNVQQE